MITDSYLPVRSACVALEVSKSAYYQHRGKEPAANKDEFVLAEIRSIAGDFSKYGYRRMTKELQRREMRVNISLIQDAS